MMQQNPAQAAPNHHRIYPAWALITILLCSLLLTACGSRPYRSMGITARATTITPEKKQVIKIAKKLLGTPYKYGGSSPRSGFDCSGLVQFSHSRAGISVPRTTGEQYKHSRPISRDALLPGDLVFFRITRSRFVSHVGIYLGNHRFIHAPSSGKRVSIASLENPYWQKHFVRGGRVY